MSSLRSHSFAELLTFTRASVANYCNSLGVLAAAAVDEPRIEYDAETLAVRGLLIEEARTNYLLRSQEFSNASWTKTTSNVTADAVAAPDGTLTADKLYDDATTGQHYLSQSYTKTSSSEVQSYCASVWVKAAEYSRFSLMVLGSSGSAHSASVTFTLGSASMSAIVYSGNYDTGQARIDKWPGGWYRCALDFRINNDAQATVGVALTLFNNSASGIYAGDSASGVYLWGAQLEKGVGRTSYIATTTAAATRARDSALLPFSEWFAGGAATLFVEAQAGGWSSGSTGSDRQVLSFAGGGDVKFGILRGSGGSMQFHDGTAYRVFPNSTYADGSVFRAALACEAVATSAIAAMGGGIGTPVIDAELFTDSLTSAYVGSSTDGTNCWCGYIRKVTFYPRRLSDNELRALVA
jgi:hypothetical protein